ncbi:MAG: VOC family protein [Thalassobaculales bacterium]
MIMSPISPYLTVSDAAAAIDFYVRAFGASEQMRMPAEDGKRLMHAQVLINGAVVMLSDEFPEFCEGLEKNPVAVGGNSVSMHLSIATPAEANALFDRAVAAGATVVMPMADMFWGDRFGKLRDPFGHLWSLGAPLAAG